MTIKIVKMNTTLLNADFYPASILGVSLRRKISVPNLVQPNLSATDPSRQRSLHLPGLLGSLLKPNAEFQYATSRLSVLFSWLLLRVHFSLASPLDRCSSFQPGDTFGDIPVPFIGIPGYTTSGDRHRRKTRSTTTSILKNFPLAIMVLDFASTPAEGHPIDSEEFRLRFMTLLALYDLLPHSISCPPNTPEPLHVKQAINIDSVLRCVEAMSNGEGQQILSALSPMGSSRVDSTGAPSTNRRRGWSIFTIGIMPYIRESIVKNLQKRVHDVNEAIYSRKNTKEIQRLMSCGASHRVDREGEVR
ncbi:hypothetical protein BDQ12DRAFT_668301 [Crucibulum laeve]|uniref:Uncharacterized protein n=1 Tax=Crucibulum laeve TaxID=68775 RepID=A0A5C3LTF1_9AGAR|nr:hypothetical protein BDQ12DRAFT_668301 [Crucibulum laeve]